VWNSLVLRPTHRQWPCGGSLVPVRNTTRTKFKEGSSVSSQSDSPGYITETKGPHKPRLKPCSLLTMGERDALTETILSLPNNKIRKCSMVWLFRLVSLVVFIPVKVLILVRLFGFMHCPSLVRRELV
jgi:hypothetical protein